MARRRGFGLLEAVICISLMSLLFLGAMTMIMTAARSTVRTQAQVYSTAEAANAIQNVIGQLHEAGDFSLPSSTVANQPENNWIGVGTIPMGQLSTTADGETINTAIEIISPPSMTPADNGYTQQVPHLNVVSTTAGSYWEAGGAGSPWANGPYKGPYYVQQNGGLGINVVSLIYRGDPDGTPDSAAGTYLWRYDLPPGGAFSLANPRTALCKTVGTAPNTVQFVRPNPTTTTNEVEIKIISSSYSAINGQQTNEEGSGASSSALSGKCVYMRDHYTGGSAPTNNGSHGNDVFHYH